MNKRILTVVQRICGTPSLVSEIIHEENEYYFAYKGHTMSILQRDSGSIKSGPHSLFIYANWNRTLRDLISLLEDYSPEEHGLKIAEYDGRDVAPEWLAALYRMIQDQDMNIDDIFDDILGGESAE